MQSQPLVVKENNLERRKYVEVSVESKLGGRKAVVLRCFPLFTFMVTINCFRPRGKQERLGGEVCQRIQVQHWDCTIDYTGGAGSSNNGLN